MTRDIDLIRKLLLQIEAKDRGDGEWVRIELPEYDELKITEHMFMLVERRLVEGNDTSSIGRRDFSPRRLTMDGHDFLDLIRDDENWKKTKDGALKAGGWTLDLLKDLAKGFAKKKIEDATGVRI